MNILILLFVFLASAAYGQPCSTRMVFAPPLVRDYEYGDWLISQAQNDILRRKSFTCLVNLNRSSKNEYLDVLGMDVFTDRPNLSPKQIEILKEETRATHLTIVTEGEYRIYVIKDLELVPIAGQKFQFPPRESEHHRSHFWKTKLELVFPNALSLGSSSSLIGVELEDPNVLASTRTKSSQNLISALSLYKIEHPNSYDTLDASASLFPTFTYLSIRQEYSASDSITADLRHDWQKLSVTSLCPGVLGQVSLYWHLGTTYLGLGAAPCYLRVKDGAKSNRDKLLLSDQVQIGHRVFLTRRVFLSMQLDFFNFERDFFAGEIAHSKQIIRAAFELGWFFPPPRSLFDRL